MAGGITGLGSTYALPNYAGELTLVTPTDTPFLTAIGGLTPNAEEAIVSSTDWEWQTEDLEAPGQPNRLEGQDADFSERRRANVRNVVQIFQYGVNVSYTKQAATQQLAGTGTGQSNPVQNELDHQIQLKLKQAARDINWTFINGQFQQPLDNTQPRRTRGILEAIATNVVAAAGAPLVKEDLLDLIQAVYDARGIHGDAEPTILTNSTQKRKLTDLFVTQANYQEQTRNVGGVNLQTIETDFGRLNLMLDRSMPTDTIAFVHLGFCRPKFLVIPGKGFLFVEPLAKTGSSEKYQLYGEVGLQYGDEAAHAKMTGLSTDLRAEAA